MDTRLISRITFSGLSTYEFGAALIYKLIPKSYKNTHHTGVNLAAIIQCFCQASVQHHWQENEGGKHDVFSKQ
jgi:hypothetical protein